MKTKGQVTIPTDSNFINETKEIMAKWGADAVRDCDGTKLPQEIKSICKNIYSTYFVTRGDNNWANNNMNELQHYFVMSDRQIATSDKCEISLMKGFCKEQITPDYSNECLKYFQVIDRTTGKVLEKSEYDLIQNDDMVLVKKSVPMHEYTASFMAKNIWDSTQMYNYLTNDWNGDKHKVYDPNYPKTKKYIKEYLQKWLNEHKDTTVIRFTTFIYHFTLLFNDKRMEKYVDWFGYTSSVSPLMLDEFAQHYGYALTAEDFIDKGYYNNPFRVPTKQFKDYISFVQKFVSTTVKELVDIVHLNNREAMMFLGDSWIGTEPYGNYFGEIGLDAVVGSVGGGVTVRMLTDIPHVKYVEGRFLPYFFPDTFFDGNEENAVAELNHNWMTARRAMMRKPLDRIGYGGYLSLAAKFPTFIDRVEDICKEFRTLHSNIKGVDGHANLKVAILNAWGKLRSWQSHMVAHELWYQQIYSYQGILEILSGLPVDVEFISFDDIKENGVPSDINVIINAGDAGTAFSGGDYWKDEKVVTTIKQWVYNGGGFIGVGEPSAVQHGGKYFQLYDVMGVDKEVGFSLSSDKYNIVKADSHFITSDIKNKVDYGEGMKNIYAINGATVIDVEFSNRFTRKVNVGEVKMATNNFGKGRGLYLAGLPFSFENSRLLYRAMHYVANKENELLKCFSSNIFVDCHYYHEKKKYAFVNNTIDAQITTFYNLNGAKQELKLEPMEIKWLTLTV